MPSVEPMKLPQPTPQPTGALAGLYRPSPFLGSSFQPENLQLSTEPALVGLGERPSVITTAQAAELNKQGIAVPKENIVPATTAQAKTITLDPLDPQYLATLATSLGTTPAALINTLPPNIRLLINSMPPDQARAIFDQEIANKYAVQRANQGDLNMPSGTDVELQIPQTNQMAQTNAEGQAIPSPTSVLPVSPMLANAAIPSIQNSYDAYNQMLDAGMIDTPTYWALVQDLIAQMESSNPTQTPSRAPAPVGYTSPRKRQMAYG